MTARVDNAQGLAEALTRRRFDIMLAQVKTMRWPFVAISGVMAAVAARAVPLPIVGVWLAVVLLVFLLRELWLSRQIADDAVPATQRVRGALVSNLVLGLSYGVAALFMRVLDETASAVLTTIAVSSAAGAVAISGTLPRVYLSYTLGIMIPFAAVWACSGTLLGVAMAVLMGVFVMLQYRFARKVSEMFKESFLIRRENEALVEQLTLARDQAHAASVAKTRFLAAASHDLRQPMHALSMQSGALLRNPHAEDAPAIATAISDAIADVNTLLNSLLDISKLDAGTLLADRRPIHLSRLLESLGRSFRASVQARGLRFELDVVPEQIAMTDPILLERVLRNLVDNAVKFTARGTVRMALARLPAHFELSVSDTGVGIPAELQAKVFDEFYQIDRHARGHTQGLGLGLSIVSRLSELLGMSVVLASTPDVGTTVTLRMPRSDADHQPAAAVADAVADFDLAGLRVLVLDDEPAICAAVAMLLRREGCEVATASTSADAHALAGTFQPDVVLADYRLDHDDNGIAVIAQLRAGRPELLALLVSGDTGPDRLREAHDSGLRLLHKPVSPEQLKQALADLVAHAA
jgi:signal transduction histidine kinase